MHPFNPHIHSHSPTYTHSSHFIQSMVHSATSSQCRGLTHIQCVFFCASSQWSKSQLKVFVCRTTRFRRLKGKRKVSLHFSNQHWVCEGSRQSGCQHSQIRVTSGEAPSSYLDWSLEKQVSICCIFVNRSFKDLIDKTDSWYRGSTGRTARSHQHQAGPLGIACRFSSLPGIDPKC